MEAIQKVVSQANTADLKIIPNKNNPDSHPQKVEINKIAKEIFAKYPANSTVKKLDSTFVIKQLWMHSEWAPECQFSKHIRRHFPNRSELDPANKNPNVELIKSTFYNVRGKWALWQAPREEARWKQVKTANLSLDWIKNNVEVLYPTQDRFPVSELKGIVLWEEKSNNNKRYKLFEGNHRISAWLANQTPQTLPAIIFIGKPKAEPLFSKMKPSFLKNFLSYIIED